MTRWRIWGEGFTRAWRAERLATRRTRIARLFRPLS